MKSTAFTHNRRLKKTLKSWLTLISCKYPHTHDICLLLHLLEEKGKDCNRYLDFLELNAFAVQFRYEAFDMEDERLDRPSLLHRIEELIIHIEQLIKI